MAARMLASPDPLVSVIIPTRNRAVMTLEAVASVRRQTYGRVEIVVVDDGSDLPLDASLLGPDATMIRTSHRGSGPARSLGLSRSSGELIASLDSDDLWEPDFLERSVDAMRRHQLDLVFSNWVHEGEDGGSWLSRELGAGGLDRQRRDLRDDGWAVLEGSPLRSLFLRACPAPSSSLLLRRELIGTGWDAETVIADDWYLALDIITRSKARVGFTMDALWTKRVDQINKYDGDAISPAERVAGLYVHDLGLFRRDFAARLSGYERLALGARHAFWRAALPYVRWREPVRPASPPVTTTGPASSAA